MKKKLELGKRKHPKTHRIKLKGTLCVYCGQKATQEEHFPPYVSTKSGYLLPSCSECNRLVSTEYALDFPKRCERVKEKLQDRYKKVLAFPTWSAEELEDMGENFQETIRSAIQQKKETQKRLEWDVRSYLILLLSEYDGPKPIVSLMEDSE